MHISCLILCLKSVSGAYFRFVKNKIVLFARDCVSIFNLLRLGFGKQFYNKLRYAQTVRYIYER